MPEQPDSHGESAGRTTQAKGRAALVVLKAGAALTALLALAQPFLAGGFLQGYYPLLKAHEVAAMVLATAALIALVGGILVWRPGGGPADPARRYAVLVVAIVVQMMLGYSRVLLLHIPLGVGIFVMAEKFAADVFRLRPGAAPGGPADLPGARTADEDAAEPARDGAGGDGASGGAPAIGRARSGDSEVTA